MNIDNTFTEVLINYFAFTNFLMFKGWSSAPPKERVWYKAF